MTAGLCRRRALGFGPVWLALGAALACSSTPASPFFGDEHYLVLGVSPEQEAEALRKQLEPEGYREYLRLRASTFTALGFVTRDGEPALVRVITARGIALALNSDSGHPLDPGARYELLAPAVAGRYDADDDGFDDLIVIERDYARTAACVHAFRVLNTGVVEPQLDAERVRKAARNVAPDLEPCVPPESPRDAEQAPGELVPSEQAPSEPESAPQKPTESLPRPAER